jgi:hypothetical protein
MCSLHAVHIAWFMHFLQSVTNPVHKSDVNCWISVYAVFFKNKQDLNLSVRVIFLKPICALDQAIVDLFGKS